MLRVATRFREACRPGPVWRRSARLHPWLDWSATRTIPASFAERATFLGGEKLLSFVIGTGRCGSSLVTEVIARHPEVGFVSGLDDKLPGLDLPGRWNNALFRRSSPRDAGLVTFPDARFVHVIRDGRAVASSWLQMPWWSGFEGPSNWSLGPLPAAYSSEWERSGRSFVVLAGLGWKLLMDAFDAARMAMPPRHWLDVRYEDVLAEPRKQFAVMLEFLDLEWTPRFEAGFKRHTFSGGRTAAFRQDLDQANLALLERSLAGRLLAYDYPLTPQGGPR